mmetsp:Transcript_32282/g.91945  ORF Transcript_32282/g.91945 Transcript_32282/m.91945 type:complete len:321 (-) Transcript_32282:570-1532(-)
MRTGSGHSLMYPTAEAARFGAILDVFSASKSLALHASSWSALETAAATSFRCPRRACTSRPKEARRTDNSWSCIRRSSTTHGIHNRRTLSQWHKEPIKSASPNIDNSRVSRMGATPSTMSDIRVAKLGNVAPVSTTSGTNSRNMLHKLGLVRVRRARSKRETSTGDPLCKGRSAGFSARVGSRESILSLLRTLLTMLGQSSMYPTAPASTEGRAPFAMVNSSRSLSFNPASCDAALTSAATCAALVGVLGGFKPNLTTSKTNSRSPLNQSTGTQGICATRTPSQWHTTPTSLAPFPASSEGMTLCANLAKRLAKTLAEPR